MNTSFAHQGNGQAIADSLPQLPRGIAAELDAAAQRTGWTTALQIAAARLPRLLRMEPVEFERMAGRLYNEVTTI